MMFHRDAAFTRCLELWKRHFYLGNNDTKLQLLYLANDVLIQSSRKNKPEYIKGFGDMFVTVLRDFIEYKIFNISSADRFELLNAIHLLCDSWESNMIYANNFMNIIRKYIREKQQVLGNEDLIGKVSVTNQYSSEIRQICTNKLSAKVLEGRIDEMNLKYWFII